MKEFILSLYLIMATGGTVFASENWPKHVIKDGWLELGREQIQKYQELKYDPNWRDWTPFVVGGDYFRYSKTIFFRETDRIKFDENGLPQQKFGEDFAYNPVQIANYALAEWGRMEGDDTRFLTAARHLLGMQSEDGAFPLDFTYRHYTQVYTYKPGWVDAMSPGLALSVFARAFLHTGDEVWLEAGNRTVSWLQVPFPEGAKGDLRDLDPSLSGYVWWMEYPTKPHVFTLNGYIFTLIGLHEWAEVGKSQDSAEMFEDGLKTLEKILPYYDIGNFSTYDLSYITYGSLWFLEPQKPHMNAGYHHVHIYQLRALHSITGIPTLKWVADRWNGYTTEQVPADEPSDE